MSHAGGPGTIDDSAQTVSNPGKDKGDKGEREVQELLRSLLHLPGIRRALGAGRKDDVGDIDGVPQTAIQVAWWSNPLTAINAKIGDVERQRRNKRVRFGVLFVRRTRVRSGPPWIVVMTPEQFARMHKYAMMGVRAKHYKWCPGCERERPVRFFNHDMQAADRVTKECADCRSKTRSTLYSERRRKFVQDEMGGECERCGFSDDWRALQIDHVNGGGSAESIGSSESAKYQRVRDNPEKYQLLCANCNAIKRIENGEHAKLSGTKGTRPTQRRLTPQVAQKIAEQQVDLERRRKAAKMSHRDRGRGSK